MASVFLPCWAPSRARAAAVVLFPTPPLPLTNSSLRSRSSGTSWIPTLLESREPHAALAGLGADLDVGDLRRRDADLAALAVGEPQPPTLVLDGVFDGGDELVAVGVVGHFDFDLLRRVGHADPDFHVIPPGEARARPA